MKEMDARQFAEDLTAGMVRRFDNHTDAWTWEEVRKITAISSIGNDP